MIIYPVLTTYKRQALALTTVQKIMEYARYDGEFRWILVDDGSGEGYLDPLLSLFPCGNHSLHMVYDSNRRGVGHGMNVAIDKVSEVNGLIMMLEDDWEMNQEYDFTPDAHLLRDHDDTGMIRYGYISPGMLLHTFARSGRLWFKVEYNGYQYRFSGHPSLRHPRFHAEYGLYKEGISAGDTEVDMCFKTNQNPHGPMIIVPAYPTISMGIFNHIGTESLNSIKPGER